MITIHPAPVQTPEVIKQHSQVLKPSKCGNKQVSASHRKREDGKTILLCMPFIVPLGSTRQPNISSLTPVSGPQHHAWRNLGSASSTVLPLSLRLPLRPSFDPRRSILDRDPLTRGSALSDLLHARPSAAEEGAQRVQRVKRPSGGETGCAKVV